MARRRLRRLVTRRRVKWVGVVASASVGVTLVLSVWMFGSMIRSGPYGGTLLAITQGRVWIYKWSANYDTAITRDTDFQYGLASKPLIDFGWNYYSGDSGQSRRSSAESPGMSTTTWGLQIPLWFPLLLIAAPTAWLWHTDRRAKPWQCPKCRYDLRGLDGGVCPECGKPEECER